MTHTSTSTAEPQLELVKWTDAYFYRDDGDEYDDYIMQTVGWVSLSESGEFLRVASEKQPHDDGFRCVTYIPRVNIVRRLSLRTEEEYPPEVPEKPWTST